MANINGGELENLFLPCSIHHSSATTLPLLLTRRSVITCVPVISVATLSCPISWSKPLSSISNFSELPDSGGAKTLDLRSGDGTKFPTTGDQVSIHFYGRLAAKQGWRFDSTYDHRQNWRTNSLHIHSRIWKCDYWN